MDNKDLEFQKRIQATFRNEADEHLRTFSKCLIELEKTSSRENSLPLIETMFREIHSLKGAARSVGQKEIELVCQPLENVLSSLKRHELDPSTEMINLFHETHKSLSDFLFDTEIKPEFKQIQKEIIVSLNETYEKAKRKEAPFTSPEVVTNPTIPVVPSTVIINKPESIRKTQGEVTRISVSKLEPLLLEAEEFSQTSIIFKDQTDEITLISRSIQEMANEWRKWKMQRRTAGVHLVEEWIERNELKLFSLESQLLKVTRSMDKECYSFDRMVNDHLESMKKLLMLPVALIVEAFPGMVREIAVGQGKEIDFSILGSDLEIDKRIMEELKDPLIHLIRNSVDHGIEKPADRIRQGKLPKGNITLRFNAEESGNVEILISDDGRGINEKRIIEEAVKSQIISHDAAAKLSKEEILDLIFLSGLSTSQIITDLSGRGLGLSIVREKVGKMNGILSIQTKENKGTTFRILLPRTLASFRGFLVRSGDFSYMIPTMNVARVLRVKEDEIKTIENRDTLRIGEDLVSVASLAEVLHLPIQQKAKSKTHKKDLLGSEYIPILLLVSGQSRIAFKVDEIIGEYPVLVKGLGKLLKRVRNISGATILGSGKIVPLLHVADLMKATIEVQRSQGTISNNEKSIAKTSRILVAEDSITSRMLLKNILESAGYEVTTAVDGMDAFTHARNDQFDLIVSDVDMPRMNGFELTSKIKGDKNLKEIPVILVTSLESPEDKERGIEVGADGYIIKSKFDQGNLLDVIMKLI